MREYISTNTFIVDCFKEQPVCSCSTHNKTEKLSLKINAGDRVCLFSEFYFNKCLKQEMEESYPAFTINDDSVAYYIAEPTSDDFVKNLGGEQERLSHISMEDFEEAKKDYLKIIWELRDELDNLREKLNKLDKESWWQFWK